MPTRRSRKESEHPAIVFIPPRYTATRSELRHKLQEMLDFLNKTPLSAMVEDLRDWAHYGSAAAREGGKYRTHGRGPIRTWRHLTAEMVRRHQEQLRVLIEVLVDVGAFDPAGNDGGM